MPGCTTYQKVKSHSEMNEYASAITRGQIVRRGYMKGEWEKQWTIHVTLHWGNKTKNINRFGFSASGSLKSLPGKSTGRWRLSLDCTYVKHPDAVFSSSIHPSHSHVPLYSHLPSLPLFLSLPHFTFTIIKINLKNQTLKKETWVYHLFHNQWWS